MSGEPGKRNDRLVNRGWVIREKLADDRRVTYAVLTDAVLAFPGPTIRTS